MRDTNNQGERKKQSHKLSMIVGIAVAIILFFVAFSKSVPTTISIITIAIACILAGNSIYNIVIRLGNRKEDEKFARSLGQIMLETVIKMKNPMVICDTTGKIIWRNRAFASVTETIGSVMGVSINTISSIDPDDLSNEGTCFAELCECRYQVDQFAFRTDEKNYWFLNFTDMSELDSLNARIESERSVVAYIIIDNLDELSQSTQDKYRSEANDVSAILRTFADSLNGILREYDRNRYLLMINRDGLAQCRKTNFDILDKVRDIRVGDLSLPITISMGITDVGETLSDREAGAREALSMALARGGDQVAYKSEGAMEFYGGNTRPVQKRSSDAAKVRSGELVTRISRASNVIIMGHRGADQDCFGASAGIARLAMFCYVKPYIVVDKNDPNTKAFVEKFEKIPEYADVFVDENEAQSLIKSDTLLTVVDVNNIDHMLSSGIALAVNDAVIIDHHRKTDSKVKREWLAEYIEPSVSSASELVAEILEQSIGEGKLLKEEADALLGGIVLDTKQFTKATGTRTFNAAIYLRSAGASIYESASDLKSEYNEFKKQAKIMSDLVIYKGRYAIAKDEEEGQPLDRIAAAKAAETLLTIKGVDAAFALIRIGGETHISARSNAAVSVQLIAEKIGGGGHLDSAGAKSGGTMLEALEKLKAAIDEYIEENDKSKK